MFVFLCARDYKNLMIFKISGTFWLRLLLVDCCGVKTSLFETTKKRNTWYEVGCSKRLFNGIRLLVVSFCVILSVFAHILIRRIGMVLCFFCVEKL